MQKILITGGAGYVGAVLVPKLLEKNYQVKVIDLFIYGDDVLDPHPNLEIIKGDIRDTTLLKSSLTGIDCVIHLACISNDPSFDLNPTLGKSINLDSFRPLVEISKQCGVERFIYASSSSVYGIKEEPNVHEEIPLNPLTDYSKFKAQCEVILNEFQSDNFTTCTIRPATVCGYSRRQRLDVIVNILTNHAINNRKIKVFGGDQKRPNIHIEDMAQIYIDLLELPKQNLAGKIFNAGSSNHTVTDLALMVQKIVGDDVTIEKVETDDNRSYHICSQKIQSQLGFKFKHSIEDAVRDLKGAFSEGKLENSMENEKYFNIKTMLTANIV